MRSEWEDVKLKNIVDFNPRETLKKGILTKKIGMADIVEHQRKVPTCEIVRYTSGTRFKNEDTLFAKITPCLENGKIAQVDFLDDGEIGFGSTEFIVWRAKPNITDPDFVFYLANYQPIVDTAIKSMVGTSGRQRVQLDVLENYEFISPPLPTQKAIAATLSCLDAKIEVNNKIIKNLEQQAQAIFKSWFVDFEPFQDGEFVESELGLIPKGWKLLRFGDFIASRNEYGNNPKVPTYSVTNTGLHLRRDIFKRRLSSSETKNKVLYKGDLVFGMSRNILNWGIMKDRIGEVSSAYQVYEINQKVINSWYVELFIDQQIHYFYNLIRPASREGQGVDRGLLPTKYIYIPPIDWVDRYLDVIEPIKKGQKISEQQNTTLAALRNTLLPKLMSGEIEVPVEQD